MAVAKSARDQAIEAIKLDLVELKKIFARIENTDPMAGLRHYERLAFEKAREMVLAGKDPETMRNPYEVGHVETLSG